MGEAGFGEVEFAFEVAEDFVVDFAFVPELDGGVAFEAEEIERKRDDVAVIVSVDTVLFVALAGEGGEAAFIFGEDVVVRGGEMVRLCVIFGAQGFDLRQRGFQDDATRFVLFDGDHALTGESEFANERRQGEALQHERGENHAESQKDNQIALREWGAVGECEGKRESCGECDDAAHSSPTDDEDAFYGRHRLVLMEDFSSNEIGDEGSGEKPRETEKDDECTEESAVEKERLHRILMDAGEDEGEL